MSDQMMCPRRMPGYPYSEAHSGPDEWRPPRLDPKNPGLLGNEVRTCSYCGSMHPDDVMAGLEDHTLIAGPTDKNYKLYIDRAPTDIDKARLKKEAAGSSPMNSGKTIGKFYFQHLSDEQCHKFVDMMNDRAILIAYPGHFYTLPFFVKV